MTPRILIIAGSDSGGGAGIQADIKTVTMLGGHAMTAVTAITAQNTLGVQAVMPVPAEMVIAQIESCVSDIGVDAIKIGMLGSAETAHAVADWLERFARAKPFPGKGRGPVAEADVAADSDRSTNGPQLDPGLRRERQGGEIPIVFDPVMVATSGDVLADSETIAAFERLMRIATVTTPNLPELAALSSVRPERVEGLPTAGASPAQSSASKTPDQVRGRTGEGAQPLAHAYGAAVLVKGGHGEGDEIVDRLISPEGEIARWSAPRIDTISTHGTGCTLASAIATYLAHGHPLSEAVAQARQFVRLALYGAPGFGQGHGPMGHHNVRLDLGPGIRLNQVTLPLGDGSVDFYRELGLKQIVATDDGHYARFEAPGGATLSVEHGARPTVFFECDDLDTEVARLQAAGVTFDHLPVEQEWLWREARLTDPAGNTLCLYQAGENRRYPPWRLPDA